MSARVTIFTATVCLPLPLPSLPGRALRSIDLAALHSGPAVTINPFQRQNWFGLSLIFNAAACMHDFQLEAAAENGRPRPLRSSWRGEERNFMPSECLGGEVAFALARKRVHFNDDDSRMGYLILESAASFTLPGFPSLEKENLPRPNIRFRAQPAIKSGPSERLNYCRLYVMRVHFSGPRASRPPGFLCIANALIPALNSRDARQKPSLLVILLLGA